MVIGPNDNCYKRPRRCEEKARSSLPAILRLGLTGHWWLAAVLGDFLAISIFVLPRRKEGMPLCVVCRPLKFGRGPEWAVGGSALPWSERKLLPVTGCCLMTTKLESFVSFLCKRQAEVWSCSPWWWMPQSIFSAPCSGASPECWCWRRVGSCRGRARSQCLGVHCMVKPS